MFDTAVITPSLSNSTQAFSVTEINTMVSDVLSSGLPSFLWVEGEISNLSVAGSGHRYLSLKDSGSSVACALFKGASARISRDILTGLKNGDKVVVKASLSVYKPRGNYQLIISDIEPAGFGELAKAFAKLKEKLEREGLTDSLHKKSLPHWPQQIGIVTSETGAAIQDVITTLARRAPFLDLSIYPTLVQGDKAPHQIIQALKKANHPDEGNDVILLVRGGGSLEDLQAFNDEVLAYAVFNSRLPLVTGVGHETDFTIVDFVSDSRAPTPTAAAELISPDKITLGKQLNTYATRLKRTVEGGHAALHRALSYQRQRLLVQHPQEQLQQQSQRLDELSYRLRRAMSQVLQAHESQLARSQQQLKQLSPLQQLMQWRIVLSKGQERLYSGGLLNIEQQRKKLDNKYHQLSSFYSQYKQQKQCLLGLEARLKLLSPLGILDRGYALVYDEGGTLIKQSSEIHDNTKLSIRFSDGLLAATVKVIKKGK